MFADRESMSRTPGHDDERVLENFVDLAGRLISIPVQHKKRLAVLKWLVEDFQPGRVYPESEVNRVISRRHPDFAALRRQDRKSTRLNSSHSQISYAVFCLKKKNRHT